jgi:hypothetical protein
MSTAFSSALCTTGTDEITTLGQLVKMGSNGVDSTLFYLTAAGAVAGGPGYRPASTDIAYVVPARTGDVTWVRVQNDSGGTLQRGQIVKRKLDAMDWQVDACGANEAACAVLQYDVADGEYAWAVREGWCEALTSGAETKGALVKPAAAGVADTGTAGTDLIIGIFAETVAGAGNYGIFFRPVA